MNEESHSLSILQEYANHNPKSREEVRGMQKTQRGFTLIELLVVIAIIGILAALVLVALGNARDKANDARVKSDIGQLRTLAEVYYDANNASYAGLGTCLGSPSSGNCAGGIETSVASLKSDISSAVDTPDFTANSSADEFCISSNLKSAATQFVCVDASGEFIEGLAATADCDTATACPES